RGIPYSPRGTKAARFCKVPEVIIVDIIVVSLDPSATLRQIRKVKHQETGGIVIEFIVIDFGVRRVLDLTASHIFSRLAVPYDSPLGLPHIDSRIRRAFRIAIFNEHVAT